MVAAQECDRFLVFRIAHDGFDFGLRSRIGLRESGGTHGDGEASDSSKMFPHVTSSTPEVETRAASSNRTPFAMSSPAGPT
jgi:hypothetical protein